ncbi:MAG: endonuclease domain-containing protein [Cyanobacteria bacterium P01_A01_bin.105]
MSHQPYNPLYLPYNHALLPRARALRKNMTPAEQKLWHGFLKKQPVRFLRQRPIDNFIVDFYGPSWKLIIEVDGNHHDTALVKAYDDQRTSILEAYGMQVVRFTNQQVMHNFEDVCQQIQRNQHWVK